jgi:hypothetical protein
MKAILLKAVSMYDALGCYIDELAAAFRARGHDAAVIDLRPQESVDNFVALLKQQCPADLVFSFNIYGEFVDAEGHTLSAIADAPLVVQYVDFPVLHFDRLSRVPRTTAVLTIDPSHMNVIAEFFGPHHFAYLGFSPVAAMGAPQPLPATADEFLAARPVKILCAQSYFLHQPPPWIDFPEFIRDVFTEAAELALAEEWVPPQEALDRSLIAHGLDLDDPALRQELMAVRTQSVQINEWVRRVRRQRFFAAADEVGLPLTAYGSGYDTVAGRYHNIDYRGLGDMRGTPARMREARIVINHNSNFGEGLHDRVPSGMLAGAAVATDTSRYYRDHYESGRDIALFRWQHLEEDLAAVKTLLEDGDALFAMAQAGQQKALHHDRWEHRVDTILAAAEAARNATV